MQSRFQRLETLAVEAQLIRKSVGKRQKIRWPDIFQRKAAALMHSGFRAGELSERLGVPVQTLHTWRLGLLEKRRALRAARAAKKIKFHEISVKPNAPTDVAQPKAAAAICVRMKGGAKIAGLTFDELLNLIGRGVL